ncbi:hypothetical protein EOA35_32120, partial [Mesorhizobium sp. M8A.F.Ca.ET.023.01.1.1]
MKAGMFSFPKAYARSVAGICERARLALKWHQQKWNPVLRRIARQPRVRDQQRRNLVLLPADGNCESLPHSCRWRNEAPRKGSARTPRRGRPADQIRKAPAMNRNYLFLFLFSLLMSFSGLASLPPIDRDESRFVQATKQMVETGDYIDIRFQDV